MHLQTLSSVYEWRSQLVIKSSEKLSRLSMSDRLYWSFLQNTRRSPFYKLRSPVVALPTHSPTNGSGLTRAGSSLPRAGSSLPRAGSSLPRAGSGLTRAGSSLPRAGSSLPRAGSSLPRAGSSLPRAGSSLPRVFLH
ncbi:hypothetical protein [Nostoc sp.]|uniref:hypothetical protein n=1 Tax=Nostoc sp. TaxID=1180 RepID=UPI002FF6E1A6